MIAPDAHTHSHILFSLREICGNQLSVKASGSPLSQTRCSVYTLDPEPLKCQAESQAWVQLVQNHTYGTNTLKDSGDALFFLDCECGACGESEATWYRRCAVYGGTVTQLRASAIFCAKQTLSLNRIRDPEEVY